jgi:hypothetical protein
MGLMVHFFLFFIGDIIYSISPFSNVTTTLRRRILNLVGIMMPYYFVSFAE